MAPEEFTQIFVSVGNIHGCLTRSGQNCKLQLPKMKLKCAQGSISYSGAKLWNTSPRDQEVRDHCLFQGIYKDHLTLEQSA